MRRLAEEVDADILDGRLNSIEAGSLALGVYLVNQVVNLALVRLEPWVDISLVNVNGALFARHDEVEVQCKAHPGVEWHPVENEVELRFNHEEQREGGPVHKPWCEVGGIASADGFVRGENWKEDRGDGAGLNVSGMSRLEYMTGVAYVRMSAMKPNMVEVDSQRRMECRKKECSSLSVRISKLDIGEELDRYRQVSYLLSGRGSRIR
jgi:hypothetical protein